MAIRIDADALFRAVTASGHKLLAFHLDRDTGEVISRTLRPEEVAAGPEGPSVKPLPKLGGDLTARKDATPFGPPPVDLKKNLFSDDGPKKSPFESEFFKRPEKPKAELFGDGGFRKVSGTKKLAELFGEATPSPPAARSERHPAPRAPVKAPAVSAPPASGVPAEDPRRPRIPVAPESQQLEWMRTFARDCGDPQIRDQLYRALETAKPVPAFERALQKHQRMGQQWERYFRKIALAHAEAWLSELGEQWELVEPQDSPR